MVKRHINIPVFIPHEGCPNDCVFCNQRKISGQSHAPSINETKKIIEEHLRTKRQDNFYQIAFFGGSFTGLPVSDQIKYLDAAETYVQKGMVDGIRLSTRPDYINQGILHLLKRFSVKVIELGIQSLDNEVLKKSYRGYHAEKAIEACRMVKCSGFSLGVQVMIGLPGDTLEKSLLTTRRVLRECPDMVRVYPTLVIQGTELETQYLKGEYHPLNLEEAVVWCSKIIPLYEAAGVHVLRIGLQNTDNIKKGCDVLAGPVHPAFGELVYSRIWLNKVIEWLRPNDKTHGKKLIIHVAPSRVSTVIGQHRRNIQRIKERYGFSEIKVRDDQNDENALWLEILQ